MLTMTERMKFAQTISNLNLDDMTDDDLRANLNSGEHMLSHPNDYQFSEDTSILLKFWISEYTKEMERRGIN